jgi:hypothetical protein
VCRRGAPTYDFLWGNSPLAAKKALPDPGKVNQASTTTPAKTRLISHPALAIPAVVKNNPNEIPFKAKEV